MSATPNCTLLLHDSLLARCAELLASSAGKSLVSTLQQIESSPGGGQRIKGTEIVPKLKGKLYKAQVGGRHKFRLFYYHHAGRGVVLPLYISEELRGELDYTDITPIVESAVLIVDDYEQAGGKHFTHPQFAS